MHELEGETLIKVKGKPGYKLSQDHLEVFFSAMRSRGGYNNNSNAIQFRTAYIRLLVRHEIKESEFGSCSPFSTT
ncbi:THAP-type domain-containing protein [Aphis craccivora]|uniref:THAP-type domain-containing protein n=1 Tax=Aphis craccivora TaxID=307492 RepID=A0A6G0YPM9_APHCR|nr:THAP-type domain-containing protein [Aphis craccivora]